jgi:hypothetical protein
MRRSLPLFFALTWIVAARWATLPAAAGPAPSPASEVTMEHVGKAFLIDYGELVIKVRYLSDRRLAWEQVKGPDAGLKAEEDYGSATIRPHVRFFWWQEKDTSVVSQVVDFEKRIVHTTWTSPDKKLAAFQRTLRPDAP